MPLPLPLGVYETNLNQCDPLLAILAHAQAIAWCEYAFKFYATETFILALWGPMHRNVMLSKVIIEVINCTVG